MSSSFSRPAAPPLLVFLLGTVTALGSLSIDTYLPAFPMISRNLLANAAAVQETLAAFFVGTACGQLVYGPLSDRWGRKNPLLAGLALYTLASVGCALAPNIGVLAGCRMLQGLGGCAGMVIARAVVRDHFDEVGSARIFSQMMMVMGVAPILAPLVGGQIVALGRTDDAWRLIFWLLVLFGVGCSLLVARLLPKSTPPPAPASASPLAVLGTFALVLRDPRFLVPTLILSLLQSALFSYITGSSAILIDHFGVAPQHYGLFFGANAAGLIAASQINRLLLRRFSPPRIVGGAVTMAALFGVLLALVGWSGRATLPEVAALFFLLLTAFGFAMANSAAWALAQQGRQAGSASALMGTASFALSALAGSAVAGMTRLLHGEALRATSLLIVILTGTALALYRLRGIPLAGAVPPPSAEVRETAASLDPVE